MKVRIPYRPRYPEVHGKLRERRFCVLVAHRRFGKTVLAVNHLIRSGVECAKEGGHFAYVAPYRNQAKSVAWDYLRRYTRYLGKVRVNESELSVTIPSAGGPCKIRIFGADNPDSLRGLYFDGVVLDEVAQMKPDVWEEIIQPALVDRRGFAVFIGTPKGVNLFSRLYYQAAEMEAAGSKDWGALRFPVSETNALPAEEVERLREEMSENKFRQEMECDFTASGDDALINLDEVREALGRKVDHELAANWPLIVGVDVARFGEDATVFFPRRGLMAMNPVVIRKKSNTEVAHRLLAYISETNPDCVCVDQGQGTGVIDVVRDVARNATIVEVPFGSRANADDKYVNRRSEMWTLLRDWLRAGGALPKKFSQALAAELTAPFYSFDSRGRVKLEPKEEIKKRLRHSTDIGDALALTFAVNLPAKNVFANADVRYGAGASRKLREHFRGGRKNRYDPFA